MTDGAENKSWFIKAMAATGRGLAVSGAFVGQKAVAAYRAVDPDVQRHLVQLPLLAHSLFAGTENEIEPKEADGHPPLVFVHGLGGSKGNFLFMSWMFWLKGRKRSYRIHLGASSLAAQTEELSKLLCQVAKVTGEAQLDVVAHSLGGLVARMALADEEVAGLVRSLVTLGAPHRGTWAARYGNTAIVRDLRPDSELMRRLAETPLPPSVRVTTLWSRGDLLVVPPEFATLPGAHQLDMSPFTHYSYLLHPESFEAVRLSLSDAKR